MGNSLRHPPEPGSTAANRTVRADSHTPKVFFSDPRPMGAADIAELAKAWRKLDYVAEKALEAKTTRDPRVVTSVQVDQARPGGHRLYPLVEQHLNVALDSHKALGVVLKHHGATQLAMWSLLRAQLEASVRVAWLLEPDDSRTRVSRAIHMEWDGARTSDGADRRALTDELLPIGDAERAKALDDLTQRTSAAVTTYRTELAALGETSTKQPQRFSVNNAADAITPQHPEFRLLVRNAWHVLAGLQHGDMGAWLRVTDHLDEVEIPGGLRIHLSPSDDAINRYGNLVASATINALATYMSQHQQQGPNKAVDLAGIALYRQATA